MYGKILNEAGIEFSNESSTYMKLNGKRELYTQYFQIRSVVDTWRIIGLGGGEEILFNAGDLCYPWKII